jgi:ERCC4-type nuclease
MSNILAMQIDTREDTWLKNWQAQPPAIFQDVPILTVQLENGDARLWCADGTILSVERKTPSDFLNSIPTYHIFDQVARMQAEYIDTGVLPYLVITGEIMRNPTTGQCVIAGTRHGEGWNYNAIQGALLTIQEAGVPVIFCGGDAEYAPTLERLASRNHSQMRINPMKEIIELTPQERVLCAFDGIGPETASEILKRCSTLAWALDYLTDLSPTAPKINGVAAGRKQAIIKTMQLEDGNTLAVIAK